MPLPCPTCGVRVAAVWYTPPKGVGGAVGFNYIHAPNGSVQRLACSVLVPARSVTARLTRESKQFDAPPVEAAPSKKGV